MGVEAAAITRNMHPPHKAHKQVHKQVKPFMEGLPSDQQQDIQEAKGHPAPQDTSEEKEDAEETKDEQEGKDILKDAPKPKEEHEEGGSMMKTDHAEKEAMMAMAVHAQKAAAKIEKAAEHAKQTEKTEAKHLAIQKLQEVKKLAAKMNEKKSEKTQPKAAHKTARKHKPQMLSLHTFDSEAAHEVKKPDASTTEILSDLGLAKKPVKKVKKTSVATAAEAK